MKYTENEKLNETANVQTTLMQFTEWLAEHGYEITVFETGEQVLQSSRLVYQFMKVDTKKLEIERQYMLKKLKTRRKIF